jgi:hypothetical protein
MKISAVRRNTIALATSLLVLGASTLSAAPPPGADSPQGVVERMRKASAKKDFGEIAACLAPNDRAEMAVMMLAGAGMMAAFAGMGGDMASGMGEAMIGEDATPQQKAEMEKSKKEMAAKAKKLQDDYEALLKKHGLADKFKDGPPPGEKGGPEAAKKLLKGVDEIALLKDSMAFMESIGDKKDEKNGMSEGPFGPLGEVTDYKIQGDSATAKMGDKTMGFVKVDGRWYARAEPLESPGSSAQ